MNEKLIIALTELQIDIEKIKSILNENPNIDLNACNKDGKTYLHFCFDKKELDLFDIINNKADELPFSLELLQLFKQKGARLDLSDNNQNTLLSCFLSEKKFKKNKQKDVKAIIRFLLENDSNPSRQLNHGSTYLHLVMRHAELREDIEMVKLFIEKGIDPKTKTKSNLTCLHVLSLSPHGLIDINELNVIKLLLENEVDPTSKDYNEKNALHHFASQDFSWSPKLGLLFLLKGIPASKFILPKHLRDPHNQKEIICDHLDNPIIKLIKLLLDKKEKEGQNLLDDIVIEINKLDLPSLKQFQLGNTHNEVAQAYKHLTALERNSIFTWLNITHR